jgi:putative ABC transport system ATP-binding protein
LTDFSQNISIGAKKPLLIVNNLKKIYNKGEPHEVRALDGLSFEICNGDFISIMGPSGSGKTTLLNQIAALDTPTSGTVILKGKEIQTFKESSKTELRRTKVGMVFQYNNLIPVLTAVENVELPLIIAKINRSDARKRGMEVLNSVGLSKRAHHYPDELSGGEMQRVAIARALVHKPLMVLADEPTGDLDSKTGDQILDLFEKLNKEHGETFIIVTHDKEVAKRTQKILHLKDGKLDRIEKLL